MPTPRREDPERAKILAVSLHCSRVSVVLPASHPPPHLCALQARKHRNRLSAAAHRQRKNDTIAELSELVAELREQNAALQEQVAKLAGHGAAEPVPFDASLRTAPVSVSPFQHTISVPAVYAF